MKKNLIKKIIIITVLINVVIFLVIGAKITIQKTKEAINNKFSAEFTKNMPKFLGAGGGSSFMAVGEPACTDDKDFHAQLIYARPRDAASRFNEMTAKLKSYFKSADGIVNDEAKKFNMTANLKVLCEKGEISVMEAVLPNSRDYYLNGNTLDILIRELNSLGYNHKNAKYIVFFDGKGTGCQGQLCTGQNSVKGPDDRLSEDNAYNFGPDWAIIYNLDDAQIRQITGGGFNTSFDMLAPVLMLHEYAHTMGAVQPSAPHATKKETGPGQRHCIDSPPVGQGGTDVMCKSDGVGEVFGNACPGFYPFHFDCNNDDYFNPKPELGNYLATHWNLGSKLNHFIQFGEK